MAEANIKAVITAEDKASSVLSNFGSNVGLSFSKMALAVAAGQAALQGLETVTRDVVGFFKDSIGAATDLGISVRNLTQETGMSATTSSEWIAVMDRFGITSQNAAVAIKTFSKQVVETEDANRSSATGFDKLGIKIKDTTGHTKDFNELLLEVSDKFHTLGPSLDRTAISVQLFGRQGANLLPLLNQGRAGILALEEQAKKMGLVLTANNAGALANFIKKQADMNEAVSGFKLQIGLGLMPMVTKIIDKIMAWIDANGGIEKIVNEKVIPALDSCKDFIKKMLDKLGEFIQWIKDNKDTIKTIGEVILGLAAAFTAVKVAALIGTILSAAATAISTVGAAATATTTALGAMTAVSITGWAIGIVGAAGLVAPAISSIFNAFSGAKNIQSKLNSQIQPLIDSLRKAGKTSDANELQKKLDQSNAAVPKLATGGPVLANSPYLVGEQGPELFVPSSGGTIMTNSQTTNITQGKPNINLSVNVGVYAGTDIEMRKLTQKIIDAMQTMAASKGTSVGKMLGA